MSKERIGKEEHFNWLKGIIVTTIILNILDAAFTIYWVANNKATEANPMMETLLSNSPLTLMLGKIVLVSLGCFLLWRLKENALAVIAIFVAFFAYYGITIYHLKALSPYLEPYKVEIANYLFQNAR